MVEPPSKKLLDTLAGLNLCAPAEVRRCRGRVRRLARDLPAFDSVWIDALVQARKITPFQARQLESPEADALRVGPCVLIDRLGQGDSAATYLARRIGGNQECVLKLIRRPPELVPSTLARLRELVSRLDGLIHPAIVGPHLSLQNNERLVTVCRYVPGPHLAELLVRRGRFPAAVVLEVGRQLADGLAALEERELVHGDIGLRNVRLVPQGVAVLVDAGVAPAVSPELTIHARLAPARYDGIAPELIGTGAGPNAASDIYALGCLLWHLLAGRPPFPTGDPLAKLAAHQTREIADVREWAPETPPRLAEAIRAFTARDPLDRPESFAELPDRWGPPRRAGRQRLAAFRATFETGVPRVPKVAGRQSPLRWPLAVLLLFVLSGAALSLLDAGARSHLLELSGPVARYARDFGAGWETSERDERSETEEVAAGRDTGETGSRIHPLPGPDEHGVITLSTNGPYAWKRIDWVGPLVIRGRPGTKPKVVVAREACRIVADQVTLENLHVRCAAAREATGPVMAGSEPVRGAQVPRALMVVQSQNLVIRNCTFQTTAVPRIEGAGESRAGGRAAPVALMWKAVDPDGYSGRLVDVRDTMFTGTSTAVYLASAPHRVRAANCLKLGRGGLFHLAAPPRPGRELEVTLDRVTLRQSSALVRLNAAEETTSPGRIHVQARDCVLDLAGPDGALFQIAGGEMPFGALPALRMTGEGSLARPGVTVAAFVDRSGSGARAIDPTIVPLEGLIAIPFEFAGPPDAQPHSSTLQPLRVPGRGAGTPGFDASRVSGAGPKR